MPGHATIEDLVRLNGQGRMYELVDATLVEKATATRCPTSEARIQVIDRLGPLGTNSRRSAPKWLVCIRQHWPTCAGRLGY